MFGEMFLVVALQAGEVLIENWHGLFMLVVTLLTGVLGIPATQYLKEKLGWSDTHALLLTGVVAFVLALAEVLLSGAVGLSEITLQNFPYIVGTIFAVASGFYKFLRYGEPEEEEEAE